MRPWGIGVLVAMLVAGCGSSTTSTTADVALEASSALLDSMPDTPPPLLPAIRPTKNELMGRISPAGDTAFVELPANMCSRSGMYLRKEVADSLVVMHRDAHQDGIDLTVLSATRPFSHQRSIWERKWGRSQYMGWQGVDKALDILTYSSMPGSSRHHWGTDVDLHSLDPMVFESGEGARTVAWLREHGPGYGFEEVYTRDSSRTGYHPEPWHWSFAPLAKPFLDTYLDSVSTSDFNQFLGSENALDVRIIEDFVRGVASEVQ